MAVTSADGVDDIAPVTESRLGSTNFFQAAKKSLADLTPFRWKNREKDDPVNVKPLTGNPLGLPVVNFNFVVFIGRDMKEKSMLINCFNTSSSLSHMRCTNFD